MAPLLWAPLLWALPLWALPCADGAAEAVRVAAVGDSITRGDGSHEPPRRAHRRLAGRGNYPRVLQALLGGVAEVRNFGHGGVTACNASGAPYEATREAAAARAFAPHVVVLMLGTNDAKRAEWVACLASGAARIADGFGGPAGGGARPPAVLLVEIPPVLRERWGIRKALVEPARQAIRALAAGRRGGEAGGAGAAGPGAGCASGRTWLLPAARVWGAAAPRDYLADGVHLSARGSARLARAVARALRAAGCVAAGPSVVVQGVGRSLESPTTFSLRPRR